MKLWYLRTPQAPTAACKRGFSLIELLAVMAVIAVLISLTTPVVSTVLYGNRYTRSLIQISNAFEQTREYAVSNNTYTYLGFTERASDGRIYMATFASADGSPGVTASANTEYKIHDSRQTTAKEPLMLLGKLTSLEHCSLEDDIPLENRLIDDPRLVGASYALSQANVFRYQNANVGTLNFVRVIQFTPNGEARVDRSIPAAVDLVLVPAKGDLTDPIPDNAAACVIRVAGLTGQSCVYRP